MRLSYTYTIVTVCIAVAACATSIASNSDESGPDSMITLVVLSSESEALDAVEVVALLGDGEERALGHTNGFGLLRLSSAELGDDVKVLLFCREGFFCGALRTTGPEFSKFREHLVALAPFMVR